MTSTSPGLAPTTARHAKAVANLPWHVDPVIPAADELAAPLVVDDAGEPGLRLRGQAAQRIGVEIDEVGVRVDEALKEWCEFVGGVERVGVRRIEQRWLEDGHVPGV